jgi:hypothetical protein
MLARGSVDSCPLGLFRKIFPAGINNYNIINLFKLKNGLGIVKASSSSIGRDSP